MIRGVVRYNPGRGPDRVREAGQTVLLADRAGARRELDHGRDRPHYPQDD